MSRNSTFSIIIPVFNQGELLQIALNSIFNQRLQDYEIIVVNDGSTDETGVILSGYANRITVIQQERLGPGVARNKAIARAKGTYVAFLDSDDIWFPWTLEKFYYAINKHGSPAIISGIHIDIHSEQEAEKAKEVPYRDICYKDYLISASDALWLGMCATVIRRDLLRGNETFSSLDINGEDHDLWLSLGTTPGFVYINDPPLFAYRRRKDSRISEIDRSIAGSFYLVGQEKNGHYPGGEKRRYERLTILGRHIRPVIISCIRNGRLGCAWKLYSLTLIWNIKLTRFRFVLYTPLLWFISLIKRNT